MCILTTFLFITYKYYIYITHLFLFFVYLIIDIYFYDRYIYNKNYRIIFSRKYFIIMNLENIYKFFGISYKQLISNNKQNIGM